MEKQTTHFAMPKPFSLRATALSHGWHECAPISWCEGGGCLQIIERIDGQAVRVSVTQPGKAITGSRVRVMVEAESLDDAMVGQARERVVRMLQRDLDLTEFHAMAAKHPSLRAVPKIGAGRLLRSASMFENVVKAICATNVNWTQAVKMINRIAQLGIGMREFRNLTAWPTPREILKAGKGFLVDVARLGYRADSIIELCKQSIDGTFDENEIEALARTASTDEVFARLTEIKGVGPASAHFLLGLLGHYEHMSVDSWTMKFVSDKYFDGRKVSEKRVREVYERFGRYKQLVWWFEQWLDWGTARSIVAEAKEQGLLKG